MANVTVVLVITLAGLTSCSNRPSKIKHYQDVVSMEECKEKSDELMKHDFVYKTSCITVKDY